MGTFVYFAFMRGKVPLCVNEGISFLLRNEKLTKLRELLLLLEFLILQKRIRLHCRDLLRCKFFHFNQFRAASRASKYIVFLNCRLYSTKDIFSHATSIQFRMDSLCARICFDGNTIESTAFSSKTFILSCVTYLIICVSC